MLFCQALEIPFGILLEQSFGCGPALEVPGEHFGLIVAPFGRLSISMSILDLENSKHSSLSWLKCVNSMFPEHFSFSHLNPKQTQFLDLFQELFGSPVGFIGLPGAP